MSFIATGLTQTQGKVLDFFRARAESGVAPPTLREISANFGWRSSAAARDVVAILVRKGVLVRPKGKRRGAHLLGAVVHRLPELADPGTKMETVMRERPVPTWVVDPSLPGCCLVQVDETSHLPEEILPMDVLAISRERPRKGDLVLYRSAGRLQVGQKIRTGGKRIGVVRGLFRAYLGSNP